VTAPTALVGAAFVLSLVYWSEGDLIRLV